MNARTNATDPCPMCGSDRVRWRRRRVTDVLRTWLRSFIESFWSTVRGQARVDYPDDYIAAQGYIDTGTLNDAAEVQEEIREASTGHLTPRRFWRCDACGREGHEF